MKKTVSLTENHQFRRLYRTGESVVTPFVVVYFKPNKLNYNRLGITATKKIGNAVERNRARRLIKEAYSQLEPLIDDGVFYDYVMVARRKTVFAKMQQVQESLNQALGKKRQG